MAKTKKLQCPFVKAKSYQHFSTFTKVSLKAYMPKFIPVHATLLGHLICQVWLSYLFLKGKYICIFGVNMALENKDGIFLLIAYYKSSNDILYNP